MIELFATNQLLFLFVVIGLGYLLGNVRIGGFSLGVVGVLFVGMAFGAVEPRLALPEYISVIGLVLFVYAIGLQSGPGFFASFRRRGLGLNLVVVGVLLTAGVVAVVVARLLHLPAGTASGLFCGALTNTPALAATVETIKALASDLPAADIAALQARPVVAYGLAYPFGVLGVILAFFLARRLAPGNTERERAADAVEHADEQIGSQTYRVSNPGVFGKSLDEVLSLVPERRFSLSRISKGGVISVVRPETVLDPDDLLVAVGTEKELERAALVFGERCQEHLHENPAEIRFRRMFVSNRDVAGKRLRDLQIEERLSATVTRLRRGDVEFVPNRETVLELGDRIRVVGPSARMDEITAFFGDSLRAQGETDFLSLSLGVVLGVLVGMMPIPLPGGSSFRLGFAGGPLLVSLVLGRLERTGPITWGMPYSANLVLRHLGLVLFMAVIGTRAGLGFGAVLKSGGLTLIAVGALLTSVSAVGALVLGYRALGLPLSSVMGLVSGQQTQPACLAYANQQITSERPNVAYASAYPAAMVAKIILAQVIVTTLFEGL